MSPIGGHVFDAYGTLFDVHSVAEAGFPEVKAALERLAGRPRAVRSTR